MHISKATAQQIVEEIGKLVRQNINMMDETGTIIASKDSNRIGQFHEGAYKIITEKLQELYIGKNEENELVKCGLNLPLNVGKKIVGVIGITGEYDDVYNYGQLIKKMTEILIYENSIKSQKSMDKHIRNNFLEEWILGEGTIGEQPLYERGLALGIDIRKPRKVLVISIANLSQYINSMEGQYVIAKIETLLTSYIMKKETNICFRNAARIIVLVEEQSVDKIVCFAEKLQEIALDKQQMILNIGICGETDYIRDAYLQANRAWTVAVERHEKIICYESLYAEILFAEVPISEKAEYIRKVFKGCSIVEIKEWISFLEIYFQNEGSITEAAKEMFIHKNTFQYRLNKLAQLTGVDVRLPSNSYVLHLAVLIFRQIEDKIGKNVL